jgi:dTDP-4-dehydrorhamnose 3,5-epimerase
MIFEKLDIPDVILISPTIFGDHRGFFIETYHQDKFREFGLDLNFVQQNHSGSVQGTLRGLHFQTRHVQGKLVKVVRGEIFDVAVDLRKKSSTFGHWVGVKLNEETKQQLWVPAGFAHGFIVLSDWAEILYSTTDIYDPMSEKTLLWNDTTVNVSWPILEDKCPILSQKDLSGKSFTDIEIFE